MRLRKYQIFTLSVCAFSMCTTAQANVRGMSSEQLAQFANAASGPTANQGNNNPGPRSIYNLSQAEQAYILAQVAQLKASQMEEPVRNGFTTISLKPRSSQAKEINNIEESIEHSNQQPEQVKTTDKTQSVLPKETSAEHNAANWMVKVFGPKNQNTQPTQNQPGDEQLVQQKRRIAVGQFGSAQVQQPVYQVPNNYVYTGENVIRPASSSAPNIGTSQFYARGPATIQCVIEAANKHSVPAHVLLGIASKEYGRNGQTVRNTNNSYDMGHFQINTIHFRPGEAFSNINMEDARWRGCYNAELAAWHLNRQLTRKGKEGVDFWTRAGGYHSWTPGPNRIYVYGTSKNKGLKQYAQEWQTWLNKNQQYQARY